MFERFTDRARRAIVLAQEEARRLNHNYIGTEHILLGLVRATEEEPGGSEAPQFPAGEGFEDPILATYLREIDRHAVLTPEQEAQATRRIEAGREARERLVVAKDMPEQERRRLNQTQEDGETARRELIETNLRLVVERADRYRTKGVPLLDLIQEGNIGLMQAVDRFDPRKGFRFSTYATWWIRQAIVRGLEAHQLRMGASPGQDAAGIVLVAFGISLDEIRHEVETIVGEGKTPSSGHLPFTPRAKKVLDYSLREALQLGQDHVATEHLLLGLIREGEGVAAQVLIRLGGDLGAWRSQVLNASTRFHPAPGSEARYGPLECSFCGKGRREVAKLIAGPGVGICDECVHRATASAGPGPEDAACSFCGRARSTVRRLFEERGVSICDECLDLCTEIIEGERETSEAVRHELWRGADGQEIEETIEVHLQGVNRRASAVAWAISAQPGAPLACAGCRAPLEEAAAYRVLDVPEQGGERTRRVLFLYCRRCGLTIDDLILREKP